MAGKKVVHTAAFKIVAKHLEQLPLNELREIRDLVNGMVEAKEDETRVQAEPEHREVGSLIAASQNVARGHYELKTINGCGPYKYLRYWQGGQLKSKYIGKVKTATSQES